MFLTKTLIFCISQQLILTTSIIFQLPQMNKRLPIKFISLFEVIDKVRVRILMSEVDHDTIDDYRDLNKDTSDFAAKLNHCEVQGVFQTSRAAFKLIECLSNAPTSQRPRWFDKAEFGYPLCSDGVDGMAALISLAHSERNYKKQYDRNRKMSFEFDETPLDKHEIVFATPESFEEPLVCQTVFAAHDPCELSRVCQIGFDRDELIEFLSINDIPHALRDTVFAPTGGSQEFLTNEQPASVNEENIATHFAVHAKSSDEDKVSQPMDGRTIHSSKGARRHALADYIEKAQEQVGDNRNAPAAVYAQLILMAQNPDNRPILDGFEERNGIKYLSGMISKIYTQKALSKYLKSPAREPKNSSTIDKIKKK